MKSDWKHSNVRKRVAITKNKKQLKIIERYIIKEDRQNRLKLVPGKKVNVRLTTFFGHQCQIITLV